MRPRADFGDLRRAHSRKGADTTNRRYEGARAFAKHNAEKEYRDGSTQRPGEMARYLNKIIAENLAEIGLEKPPNEKTVKGWICEFVPDNLKDKRGAPSRRPHN